MLILVKLKNNCYITNGIFFVELRFIEIITKLIDTGYLSAINYSDNTNLYFKKINI